MSDFLTSLYASIFTPGPTPPLILATNASFFTLQLVLAALLLLTWSIHFVILSFLCAGLWGGVNWFVRELDAVGKAAAAADEREVEEDESGSNSRSSSSGTETEGAGEGRRRKGRGWRRTAKTSADGNEGEAETQTDKFKGSEEEEAEEEEKEGGEGARAGGGIIWQDSLRKRRSLGEQSAGEASTDSEWDKVEELGDGNGR